MPAMESLRSAERKLLHGEDADRDVQDAHKHVGRLAEALKHELSELLISADRPDFVRGRVQNVRRLLARHLGD